MPLVRHSAGAVPVPGAAGWWMAQRCRRRRLPPPAPALPLRMPPRYTRLPPAPLGTHLSITSVKLQSTHLGMRSDPDMTASLFPEDDIGVP